MYCPLCGSKMEEIAGHTEKESRGNSFDDYYLEQDGETTIIEKVDYSIHWRCTGPNKCFGARYPLRQHHPFKGWESAPGDSWSLSWIK